MKNNFLSETYQATVHYGHFQGAVEQASCSLDLKGYCMAILVKQYHKSMIR